MGFEKTESAKLYSAIDGDTLQAIAERETAAGNPITWQELAKYNWGTDDPATINELLRDELGARKRDAANNFVISADDTPRSDLRIPKKFQKQALPLEKTHILRVTKKVAPPQFQACSSIPAATFETGKSFLRPSVADDIQAVENAILEHPDAKIMIFGHTDKVGFNRDNKALSERRAKSVFAFITNDADTWEQLYNQENWGTKAIQEILKDFNEPAFDPGEVDGIDGQKTQEAVRNYQKARGLTVDGVAGPQTRKKLFAEYMTGKHDVKVTSDQFMEPKYMGCGERNPLKRIKDERDKDGHEKDEADKEERYEENRRVTVFWFNKERLPNLPCMIGDTAPCQKRVTPPDRLHKPTFSCSFYDSLACRCSAEGKLVNVSVWLLDLNGQLMPNIPYRMTINKKIRKGMTNSEGAAVEYDIERTTSCDMEWGTPPDSDGDPAVSGVYRFWKTVEFPGAGKDNAATDIRLNNLGYEEGEQAERLSAFSRDYQDYTTDSDELEAALKVVHDQGRPRSQGTTSSA